MFSLTRRLALKWIGAGSATAGAIGAASAQESAPDPAPGDTSSDTTTVSWANVNDRVWLGADVWANPMEDWRVVDGAAECQSSGGNRNVHCLTRQLTDPQGTLEMSVFVRQVEGGGGKGGVGFRIGARSDINEFRSNCFSNRGVQAGLEGGELFVAGRRVPVAVDLSQETKLTLRGRPHDGRYELTLQVHDAQGKELGRVSQHVAGDAIDGNVALVNHFDPKPNQRDGARYRFRDWTLAGTALSATPEHSFGPLLWSMYSLSDSRGDEGFVMKLSALTGPLGQQDRHDVELHVQRDGAWQSLGTETLDPDAWTATFRVPRWDETVATPYKLVYRERGRDGSETESHWTGTIQANPVGRPLRLAALTCQNDYAFPYEPVAENLMRLNPDVLYFSGDQLYESHGGYGIIRDPAEPAILNYLRKFYMFGWAFREAMRDRPTLCIPDDHDVFQGNLWGEAGAPMDVDDGGASSNGGYREPARMVNVVHTTNAAHHPDYFDPTPVKQDISVYYGDMVYGGVGFAILGDRQFKSGPQRVDTGSGRADHVVDKNFDTSKLDLPGLVLLGERQEEFLRQWARDWRGHSMKVLLSQTVFAGVATHHGGYDGYLKADLDSGGWPQMARNRAIEILRPAKALHINGDQHLTSLVQYGVDRQRDSGWSFCTPAIAVGYPRWWRPDELGMPHANRPQHGLPDTGEYVDGLGNKVYVYAIGNPEVASKKNRYERAHQKGSGFGMVTIDTDAKTYHLESFRFLVDATEPNPEHQFPGWPLTLHQRENAGDNVVR